MSQRRRNPRPPSPHHRRAFNPCQRLLPAVVAAVLSTVALALAIFAGTDCSFVRVFLRKEEDGVLLVPNDRMDSELLSASLAHVGVLGGGGDSSATCLGQPSVGYEPDQFRDRMWLVSRVFFVLGSICLGSMSTLLSWAIVLVLGSAGRCGSGSGAKEELRDSDGFKPATLSSRRTAPTPCKCFGRSLSFSVAWKILSTATALTAVMQVPIFLLFESRICAEFTYRQSCELGRGAFLLVSSTIAWVTVTLTTQCLDLPSRQAMTHATLAWRVSEHLHLCGNSADPDTANGTGPGAEMIVVEYQYPTDPVGPNAVVRKGVSRPAPSFQSARATRMSSMAHWLRRLMGRDDDNDNDNDNDDGEEHRALRVKGTQSMSHSYDKEDKGNCSSNDITQSTSQDNTTQDSIDSRLVLRVLPGGKLPNDETPSLASFDADDLDSIVRLAEEGRLEGPAFADSHAPSPHSIKPQPQPTNSKQLGGPKYLTPSHPSQAKERVTIIGYPAESANSKHGEAGSIIRSSCSSSSLEKRAKKRSSSKRNGDVSKSNDHTTVTTEQLSTERSSGPALNVKKPATRLRVFSSKRKNRKSRQGYSMLDEESDGEDDFMSPPLEVNIVRSSMTKKSVEPEIRAAKAVVDESRMSKYNKKDEHQLMDDWKELHKYTPKENLDDGDTDIISQLDSHPMTRPIVDAYHNDPEPVYYSSSDDDDLSMSSHSAASKSLDDDDDDDNSTLSSASGSGYHARRRRERNGRMTNRGGRHRQHRRRGTSVCSLRSTRSLIEDVINEETMQDLIDEGVSDEDNGATSVKSASYALTRTLSAPDVKRMISTSASLRKSMTPRMNRRRRHATDYLKMQDKYCDKVLQGKENQNSSDDDTSVRSRKARQARIRRLQQQKREAVARKEDIIERSRTPSPVSLEEQDAEFVLDSDLVILQQRRPDGAEYGADEASL